MDEGKRDLTHSSRGRWKKTRQPKQPKYLSLVLMPASTSKSLQDLRSERAESRKEVISQEKKKQTKTKTKTKPGLFQDQPKTNRSFSGPPNSSRRKSLEKLKRIELRVKNYSKSPQSVKLPTKEKGAKCTETASNKAARELAGYF